VRMRGDDEQSGHLFSLHYSRVSEFLLVQAPPSVCDAD
jgi:hypothetical protein